MCFKACLPTDKEINLMFRLGSCLHTVSTDLVAFWPEMKSKMLKTTSFKMFSLFQDEILKLLIVKQGKLCLDENRKISPTEKYIWAGWVTPLELLPHCEH